jgi:hypothetical protein
MNHYSGSWGLPSTGSREAQYYDYVKAQEGWNTDWNQYSAQILTKLKNPDYDLAKGGVPQAVIDGMSGFITGGVELMSSDNWGYNPDIGKQPEPQPDPYADEKKTNSRESQYFNYMRDQEGWKPEWDAYYSQIMRKLNNPDYNMADNTMVPGYGALSAVPQEIISQLSDFYNSIDPMSADSWGYERYAYPNSGGQVDPGYDYRDPQSDYYQNQKDILNQQTALQDLANKNARKRQVLANAMSYRSSLGG